MKNGLFIFPLFCIIFCSLLFGCKARKDITRTSIDQSYVNSTQSSSDSTKTIETYQIDSDKQITEQDNSYIRTIEYDSIGVIRRVREEWRDIGRTNLALHRGSGSYISIDGMQSIVSTVDSSRNSTNISEHSQSDSRLVQGSEFIWIILGIAIILFIAGYFVYRKIKLK